MSKISPSLAIPTNLLGQYSFKPNLNMMQNKSVSLASRINLIYKIIPKLRSGDGLRSSLLISSKIEQNQVKFLYEISFILEWIFLQIYNPFTSRLSIFWE